MAIPFTSRTRARFHLAVGRRALAIALLVANASGAQELTDTLARSFKTRGDEAMGNARFSEALDAYQRAAAIEPSPVLDYNRARALQALGRYADALTLLENFSESATPELKARVPQLEELLSALRQRVGKLRITCNVTDARLHIGKRSWLLSSLSEPLRLEAGVHEITAEAVGHSSVTRTVDVPADGVATLTLDLQRIDSAATLKVNANVLSARVSVDGSPIGQVPLELRLPPGTHRVHLEHAGYESNESQVVLGPGEKRVIQLSLQKTPPFYTKWWFWTGVGAAAAVATVSLIAIKSEKSADTGDIPPGMLAAPLRF